MRTMLQRTYLTPPFWASRRPCLKLGAATHLLYQTRAGLTMRQLYFYWLRCWQAHQRATLSKKIMHFLMYALPHRPSSVFTGPSTLKTICGAGEPKRQLATENFFSAFPFRDEPQWLQRCDAHSPDKEAAATTKNHAFRYGGRLPAFQCCARSIRWKNDALRGDLRPDEAVSGAVVPGQKGLFEGICTAWALFLYVCSPARAGKIAVNCSVLQ